MLLSLDSRGRLAAGFNSFDAAGKPAWSTGIASVAPGASTISLPMMYVPTGTFAGTVSAAEGPREWGRVNLTYRRCGVLEAGLLPNPSTGLPSRTVTLRQLTTAVDCDLEQHAAHYTGRLVPSDFTVVP
jgi:hypothetical protein